MALGDLGPTASRVINKTITIVVVLAVLAAVLGLVFSSIGDIVGVFENNASDLNNSVAVAIAPVFGILIALTGLVGLAMFIVNRVDFRR